MPARVLLCIVFILGGCAAPTIQIQTFGSAVTKVTEKVDGVFDGYSTIARERGFRELADLYGKENIADFTLDELGLRTEVFSKKNRKDLAIIQANSALGDYAKSISDLASATSRNDIDIAASKVLASVRDLNSSYAKIDDAKPLVKEEKVISLTASLAGVGHMWVEYYRNKELKEIVTQTDDAITELCNVIKQHLQSSVMSLALVANKDDALSAEFTDYKNTVANGGTSINERILRLKKLKALQDSKYVELLKIEQAVRAIDEVQKSHAVLAKELRENKFSGKEIISAIKALHETIKHYGDLDEYLAGCKAVTEKDGKLECEPLE